jgi:hypothetical protein
MTTSDKNKDGGHSHPQNSDKNENAQGTSGKRHDQDSDTTEDRRKESFGSSGAKDSH